MKIILFNTKEEAMALIDSINLFIGSTVTTDPLETDDGSFAVIVPVVATTSQVLDLPAMIVDKQFVPPKVVEIAGPAEFPIMGTL